MATKDARSKKSISTFGWLFGFAKRAPQHSLGILAFSLFVNLLLLVSPLYMLQIYDRVLTSGSTDTLIWLSLIAVFLLGVYAAAEAGRRRVLALAGLRLEEVFSRRMFARFADGEDAAHALPSDISNLSRIQAALQNGVLLAFFDLPFTPFFIALLFLLNPMLGVLGIVGALLVLAIALVSEFATRGSGQRAIAVANEAQAFARGLSRQKSAVVAMGLGQRLFNRWRGIRDAATDEAISASKGDGAFSSLARSVRQILQVIVLGAGAALALSQEISPGGIVAASVIMSRALAPIDQIVGSWRTIVMARSAWSDLIQRLDPSLDPSTYTPLPRPSADIQIDRLSVQVPGTELPVIRPFSFVISPESKIALCGGNGSGKTTLLQTLAGVWPAGSGRILLGGRDIHAWPSEDRGQFIGYVPQDVELVPGTVADNISRFEDDRLNDVFAAAQRAGAHDLIVRLPDGYDTRVGPGGVHLSAGQRQLIGLARAFFGDPVLLLLDEPTANLDDLTSKHVAVAIDDLVRQGAIVIVSTHDPALIARMDLCLMVRDGAIHNLRRPQSNPEPEKPTSNVVPVRPNLSEVSQ
ncbi:MAG: ATP-binding cassette domain-containing protein [Pseudomonadota bacterium]